MRMVLAVAIGILACAAAVAYTIPPVTVPGDTKIVDLENDHPDIPLPPPPPILDGDGDGWAVDIDCNDDDPGVYPFGNEKDNGVDDDCNGVVDDGFDTTADWMAVRTAKQIWPAGHMLEKSLIVIDSAPRIVWTGEFYAAVWGEHGNKIRLARFDRDGALLDAHPLIVRHHAGNPDLTWTGTRFGIAYEDRSAVLPVVRLMTLTPAGKVIDDVAIENNGSEPKLAWGRDRFGIVWRLNDCAIDCVRFQRFDRYGSAIGKAEALEFSGNRAAIAFTGIGLSNDAGDGEAAKGSLGVGPGTFGIIYEASYAFTETSDVRLAMRSLEPGDTPISIVVNAHNHLYAPLGPLPSIAANPTGFAVCWHELNGKAEGAAARFVALDSLQTMPELAADPDRGRASRVVWTGSEFVAVNDNLVGDSPDQLEVHVRRLDASGNSHLAGGWGPWREVSLSDVMPGWYSSNPDIAISGTTFGIVWTTDDKGGRNLRQIWFAEINHR